MGTERTGPVAESVLQRHEPSPPAFLVGLELAGAAAERDGRISLPRCLRGVGCGPCRGCCLAAEAGAGAVHPFLELRSHIRDVESGEEIPLI